MRQEVVSRLNPGTNADTGQSTSRQDTPLEARRLDISILPENFSRPLTDYLVGQNDDITNIATQVNSNSRDSRATSLENAAQNAAISQLNNVVEAHTDKIAHIEGSYVSKTSTGLQSLQSPLNVTTSYSVNGTKVVGVRNTGWTTSSGTGQKGGLNADVPLNAGGSYSQGEMQAIANQLTAACKVIKALQDALAAHGLIG
ncbi:MAG TPA: hypothetical protein VLC98_00030 [Phnomibacter sp.]|nr:hypothetical protein [Phnomibacter sp.]